MYMHVFMYIYTHVSTCHNEDVHVQCIVSIIVIAQLLTCYGSVVTISPYSRKASSNKKPCPHCGVQLGKKSKKCFSCGKMLGVYSFGRRQCMSCGRVNLARMTRCTTCGLSLQDAPIAVPKGGCGYRMR